MSSTARPAPETDEKKSRGLGSYVLWAFVALMVYLLSGGPIALLDKTSIFKNPTADHVLGIIYAPYAYLYEHTLLRRPIGMYLHLWRPDLWNSKGEIGNRPAA